MSLTFTILWEKTGRGGEHYSHRSERKRREKGGHYSPRCGPFSQTTGIERASLCTSFSQTTGIERASLCCLSHITGIERASLCLSFNTRRYTLQHPGYTFQHPEVHPARYTDGTPSMVHRRYTQHGTHREVYQEGYPHREVYQEGYPHREVYQACTQGGIPGMYPGRYTGLYYLPTMVYWLCWAILPTHHGIPYYTTLGTPLYTHHRTPLYATVTGSVLLPDDEVLGSNLGITVGMRRIVLSLLPKV